MRRMGRVAERFADRVEGLQISVVAINVLQVSGQLLPCSIIHATMLLQAVFRACFELVKVPACFRDADDRHIELAVLDHGLQCGENFLVGKVAGCSEKYKRV